MKKLLVAIGAVLILATGVQAETFSFLCYSDNRDHPDYNGYLGEQQFSVDVYVDGEYAVFTFNNVPLVVDNVNCVITDVYFYDADLLDVADFGIVQDVSEVIFEAGATPDHLVPEYSPETADFSAGADEELKLVNGVGEGEELTIRLGLGDEVTEEMVLAALRNGDFLIGLRAIGFSPRGEEVFITEPSTTPVPEPCTLALLGIGGLLGLGGAALRRRQR